MAARDGSIGGEPRCARGKVSRRGGDGFSHAWRQLHVLHEEGDRLSRSTTEIDRVLDRRIGVRFG